MNTQNDDAELATVPFTKQKVTFFLHSHNFFAPKTMITNSLLHPLVECHTAIRKMCPCLVSYQKVDAHIE